MDNNMVGGVIYSYNPHYEFAEEEVSDQTDTLYVTFTNRHINNLKMC